MKIAAYSGDPTNMTNTPKQTPKQTTAEKNAEGIPEESGDKATPNVFKKSGKILRSPVAPQQPTQTAEQAGKDDPTPATPSFAPYNQKRRNVNVSPRLQLIYKMREMEEDSLDKCKAVLRKIKKAMDRQRNVSNDLKDGYSELTELIDVINSYRRSWQEKELEWHEAAAAAKKTFCSIAVGENTPLSVPEKRPASSPVEPGTNKRARGRQQEGWQTVEHKKRKKKDSDNTQNPSRSVENTAGKKSPKARKKKETTTRKRPQAVLVKPTEGSSYADVLKNLKEKIKPEESEVTIRSVRKTKAGNVLLELADGGKKGEFCKAIESSLQDVATVADLKDRATIEIRDLDSLTVAEEVITAVKEALQNNNVDMTVRLSNANSREQRRAFVTLNAKAANTVNAMQRIKIGWMFCRVRKLENIKRCFRCFDSGHTQYDCKGPDRRGNKLCIRCGEQGHMMKECVKTPRCAICHDMGLRSTDHIPGTRKCGENRKSTLT